MKRFNIISTLTFGGAFLFGSSDIMAQAFALEYSTEWQTDFNDTYDWLNLLKISSDLSLCDNLSFGVTTISTAKTGDQPLIDDLLTYSNIEAGNLPLTFARLGFGVSLGKAQLFVGISNVNEDYFTSDLTSFFTNSSCGISPTISCNYDIANYPMAAWSIHYRQQAGDFTFQTSLYPGKGHSRLLGHDNLFSLNISRDGIFSITSIDYNRNGINCILGAALHYGVCIADEEAAQNETQVPAPSKGFSATPWLLSEFGLSSNIALLAHTSISTVKEGCKSYAGVGLIYNGQKLQSGISVNHASFSHANECDIELSARVPVFQPETYLQPALHFITTGHDSLKCIGMLRFVMTI